MNVKQMAAKLGIRLIPLEFRIQALLLWIIVRLYVIMLYAMYRACVLLLKVCVFVCLAPWAMLIDLCRGRRTRIG